MGFDRQALYSEIFCVISSGGDASKLRSCLGGSRDCRAECKAILASVMPEPTSSSADVADPVCEQACDLKASLQGIRGQCSSPSAYENDDACAQLRDLSTHVQKACSVDPDSEASGEALPAGVSMATLLAYPIVVSLTPSSCRSPHRRVAQPIVVSLTPPGAYVF